jgi:hypothetical protein
MVLIKREPLDIPALQRELLGYEAPYRMSSEKVFHAWRLGEIRKPSNYERWTFIYAVLDRLGRVPEAA